MFAIALAGPAPLYLASASPLCERWRDQPSDAARWTERDDAESVCRQMIRADRSKGRARALRVVEVAP